MGIVNQPLLCYVITIISFSRSPVESRLWWLDQPYEDSSLFNLRVKYTENATLECNSTFVPEPFNILYWILPNTTTLSKGLGLSFHTLDGEAGWRVDNSSGDMIVTTIQERHFGFYHCVVETAAGLNYVIKKAINYNGAYFGDPWDLYSNSFIVGFAAAAVFLALAAIVLVVYNCWYAKRKPADKQTSQTNLTNNDGNLTNNDGNLTNNDGSVQMRRNRKSDIDLGTPGTYRRSLAEGEPTKVVINGDGDLNTSGMNGQQIASL